MSKDFTQNDILHSSHEKADLKDLVELTPLEVAKLGEPSVIEQEIDIQSIKDAKVKERIKISYKNAVEEKLSDKLKPFLYDFLQKLKDPALSDLRSVFIDNLDEKIRPQVISFMEQKNLDKKMNFEELRAIYSATQTSINKLKKIDNQAENRGLINAASRGLEGLGKLLKAGDYVDKVHKITTMQETKFYKKKKSLFRRIIETFLPFLKKDKQEIIRHNVQKMGSLEKSATNFAAGVVADMIKSTGEKFFDAFDNELEAKKKIAKGTGINIAQTAKQANEEAKKLKAESSAPSKMTILWQVVRAVEGGINQWAVGDYLANKLSLKPDEKENNKTVEQCLEGEFMIAAHKETFDGLVDYTRQLAILYLTSERAKGHGELGLTNSQFGFKRFDDPECKEFIIKMVRSLGFEMNNMDDLHRFLDVTEDPKQLQMSAYPSKAVYDREITRLNEHKMAAFEKYSKSDDGVVGMRAASSILTKEHKALLEKTDMSENYFYLLDLNKQVVESLQSQERIKNGIRLGAEKFQIDQRFYNAQASGLSSNVLGQLKSKLVTAMPQIVSSFLQDAHIKKEEAKIRFSHIQSNWLDKISEKLNDYYSSPVAVGATSGKAVTGLSPTQIREQWDKAAIKTTEMASQFIKDPQVEPVIKKFHQSALDEWSKSASPLLEKAAVLCGPSMIAKIYKEFDEEIERLRQAQAHPDMILQLQNKIDIFKTVFTKDGKINKQVIAKYDSLNLKLLLDSFKQGVDGVYKNNKELSLDQKEDLYMMSQAFGTLNNAYIITDLSKRAYEEIYRTHFDEISRLPSNKAIQFIAGRIGIELQKTINNTISSPATQFKYYADNKIAGKHQLTQAKEQVVESAQAPQVQGWGEWLVDKAWGAASTIGSYVAPLGVKAAEIAAVPVGVIVGGGYLAKLYASTPTPDDRSINKAVCDNAKMYIREQTFDAIATMLPQMQMLYQMDERFQQSHQALNYDTFSECGLGNKNKYLELMDDLSQQLGFSGIEEFTNFQREIEAKLAQIEITKEKIANESASIYGDLVSEYDDALAQYESELKELQGKYEAKRSSFSRLPETEADKHTDKFAALKGVVKAENNRLTSDIESGKLKNATNYVVMVSALNSLVTQLELVQKETLAVELFAPNMDEQIGISPQAKGSLAHLKQAAANELKERGGQLARSGILYQIKGDIDRVSDFSRQMMIATQNKMSEKLQQAYSSKVSTSPATTTSVSTDVSQRRAPEFCLTRPQHSSRLGLHTMPATSATPDIDEDESNSTKLRK